jgi:signal transduction protein with GAF and PtsI domain
LDTNLNDARVTAVAEYQSTLLLQPVVETALAVFGAAASSILVVDSANDCLVFGAVAGAGERSLVGKRLPLDAGIAGWVVASHETMRCDDLAHNEIFAPDVAEATGYIPDALMAAPLLFDEDCVGVLEVLDWTEGPRTELGELALLGLIANQAAAAVRLLARVNPGTDPYADPRVADLCKQIIGRMSELPPADLERKLDVLRSVVRLLLGEFPYLTEMPDAAS